jgi:hypothetical protein
MPSYAKRSAAILLLLALIYVVGSRGVVPALSTTDSDFGNYLTAAKIVADGRDAAPLYDDAWFAEQMHRYGTWNGIPGKFTPFPPPTALLLTPLARLQPLDALRVMTCISLMALAASIALLTRILSWSRIAAALLVLGSGYAVLNVLRFGQPYVLVSLACIAGFQARRVGRPWLAGVCLGLFVPLKYFPVVLLAYFGWRREWRIVLGGAAAALAVCLVSVAVLGWPVHHEFLVSVLPDHLVGRISMQDPFTASFQSFDSLARRLFVFDAAANPEPLFAAAGVRVAVLAIVKGGILLATLVTLARISRWGESAVAPSVGLLGIVTLLLAPATATYHFVLLWLPVGLLVAYFIGRRRLAAAASILGAYALIGFFPYGWFNRFEARGALTVLAYPRLGLLCAMFIAAIYCLNASASQDGVTRERAQAGSPARP